jgi:hypothetical protein
MTRDDITDRELLEFAAKAAGSIWIDDNWPEDLPGLMLDFGNGTTQWNPLDDDGDALRLAVQLQMTVMSNGTSSWVAIGKLQTVRAEESHDTDPLTATRRAIVRAAAEIGRNMT